MSIRNRAMTPHRAHRRGADRAASGPWIDPTRTAPQTSPMAARKPTTEASPVADFETSLDQLEQLVEKMEHGEMSLEESLAAYERGVGLYRRCQSALEQAELRVRLLSDPENPDNAEPFAGMPSPDA